jgi:hypothetical protein
MTHLITIERALSDRNLLGRALGSSGSWSTWLSVLKPSFGSKLTVDELVTFKSVAGDRDPPGRQVRELWAIIGRRDKGMVLGFTPPKGLNLNRTQTLI